jgi:prepilin-type N-terminal cleavage/methylation domain-containing protein
MRTRRGAKLGRGFTLAEILVALALMAVLAAVLLPTVAGQILKGDASRTTQDLSAIRSAAEQFLADVHRYPGKYGQLSKAILTSDQDILGANYTSGLVTKWKGPYMAATDTGTTGFGGAVQGTFRRFPNTTNNVDYLTVFIYGISGPDFDKVDEQIDGAPANRTAGLLRWGAGGGDTTKFFAIPIQ